MVGKTVLPAVETLSQRVQCSTKPTLVAGYLGFKDVDTLRQFMQCPQYKSVYDAYDSKRGKPYNLGNVKIPKVFSSLSAHATNDRGYGSNSPNTTNWQAGDWVAHYILCILHAAFPTAIQPKWGPLDGEADFTAWNRVWMVMRLHNWADCSSFDGKFWRQKSEKAELPPSMSRQRNMIEGGQAEDLPPEDMEYPNYAWQITWSNKTLMDEVLAEKGFHKTTGSPTSMPDPRRSRGDQWRDSIRRKFNMKQLGLNILRLEMHLGGDRYDCFDDCDVVQAICRDDPHQLAMLRVDVLIDKTHVDKSKITFQLFTAVVAQDVDIYEALLPAEVQGLLDVDAHGSVVPCADVSTDPGESGEMDGTPTADCLIPDDFQEREEQPEGFDPLAPAHARRLCVFQRGMLSKMCAVRNATAKLGKTLDGAEMTEMMIEAAMQNFLEDADPSQEEVERFRDFMRARGGEAYIGPDVLQAYDALGLPPNSQTPQLPGCTALLHDSQVSGIAWMVAQCYGQVPRVADQQYHLENYSRLAMNGGIVADDMGTGKTLMMLAFLLWVKNWMQKHLSSQEGSCQYCGNYKPSLVIAPTAIAYQWVEEVRSFFPGLKVYLYHGRNSGPLGEEFRDIRILKEDLDGYSGHPATDNIKAELKSLFDTKHIENLGTVVVCAYDTLRDRAKVVFLDDAGKEILGSRFRGVFKHVFCDEGHALRNPRSGRSLVIKDMATTSLWIATGTPILNRAEDLVALCSMLWREEFEESYRLDQVAEYTSIGYDIYSRTLDDKLPLRRFRAHPKNVARIFQKLGPDQQPDVVYQKKCLPLVNDLLLLRRTRDSQLHKGNELVGVASPIPPFVMKTVVIGIDPTHAAEMQIHYLAYVNSFIEQLKRMGHRNADDGSSRNAPSSSRTPKWRYPSRFFRLLSILSSSLAMNRLVQVMALKGYSTLSNALVEWRRRDVDYRWIGDQIRTSADPILNNKEDYLVFLSSLNEKMKYLCHMILSLFLEGQGRDRKLIIVYEQPLTGLELEVVLKALYLRVFVMHAGVPEAERLKARRAFNNPQDKSIQFFVLPYRIGVFGANMHKDCCHVVLFEGAINFNTELQAICRSYRDGQTRSVQVFKFEADGTFEPYFNHKKTQKMMGEVIGWSEGAIAERFMADLLRESGVEDEAIDMEDPVVLRRGANLVIAKLHGIGVESQSSPHINYYAIKSSAYKV